MCDVIKKNNVIANILYYFKCDTLMKNLNMRSRKGISALLMFHKIALSPYYHLTLQTNYFIWEKRKSTTIIKTL